jgi:hypothetical protein
VFELQQLFIIMLPCCHIVVYVDITVVSLLYGWACMFDRCQPTKNKFTMVAHSDSDSEAGVVDQGMPSSEPAQPSHDLIIFRVPHIKPSSMKRPMQFADGIHSSDIAIKQYDIVEMTSDTCILARRSDKQNIDIMDLLTTRAVPATSILDSMKFWTVKRQMHLRRQCL